MQLGYYDCLHAELVVRAFQSYPSLRSPIMDEIISNVLPNLDCQRRTFPVGTYNIMMASALVVQLVQVGMPLFFPAFACRQDLIE